MEFKRIFVYPKYPQNLHRLFDLAYNLWSFWDAEATGLFRRIDPAAFRADQENPVRFLHNVPQGRLEELSNDEAFLSDLDRIWDRYSHYLTQRVALPSLLEHGSVAYFSMEFGFYQVPNYAGGLGILSGDHLKGASDLGIPLVGVGLYYRYGYFNQRINVSGFQDEVYRENDIVYLPIREVKTDEGRPVTVTLSIGGEPVIIKLWYMQVGRVRLILLDTNVPENSLESRSITDYLYDADRDKRIRQEIVLGYGGMRALEAIGERPDVYHLNEGHSAFLILERLKGLITQGGHSWEEAFALVRSSTVFTTHTPVESGNESFPLEMLKEYLGHDVEQLGIPFDRFADLGALHDKQTFWLPAFAMRLSQYVNGVSKIHGEVSRRLWKAVFPNRMITEVPIAHITNGVHYSWLSDEMEDLLEQYVGSEYRYAGAKEVGLERIRHIPDELIWEAHMKRKRDVVAFLRRAVAARYAKSGLSSAKVRRANEVLNANFLTIGFARRFAAYKRPNLILKDRDRLKQILTDPKLPVQLVFAGKAHPADMIGKNMIKEIIDFAREYQVEDRVVFVENYDRNVAYHLVQGTDVWLNNPVKPLEASGTSGIKAAMNGSLNLSVLDGWWPECYNSHNGWAITVGDFHEKPEMRDLAEANQIYELLEEEIAALYYERDEHDIPRKWIQMMKEAVYTSLQGFNINRMLNQYCSLCYGPALERFRQLVKDDGAFLKRSAERYRALVSLWDKVYVKDVFSDLDNRTILFSGDEGRFTCFVYLDDADPSLFDVEVFYAHSRNEKRTIERLEFRKAFADKTAQYEGTLTLQASGSQEVSVRLVPHDEEIRMLYPDLIKWKDS